MRITTAILKKVEHVLVNLLALPMGNRERRRRFRHRILDFHLSDFMAFHRFARCAIDPDSVLLVEPGNCHGEVIAGYVSYFRELGFPVDILVSREVNEESPFCRLDKKGCRVFGVNSAGMGLLLQSDKILRYRHVVLMTSAYYWEGPDGKPASMTFLGKFPNLKRHPSLFVVEHDLSDVARFGEEGLLSQNRLIVLGRFGKGVFLSPIRFGKCRKSPKNKTTTFITVGVVKAFRKNHEALIRAIERLAAEKLKFKVVVVGSGTLGNLSAAARAHVKMMGRQDFPEMFNCLERADFFLPLLDADNPDHERYITTGETGSAQLVYAFSKVPVLHPKFAAFYGFTDDNAVLSADLTDGMRRAIVLSAHDYAARQKDLTELARKLERETTDNLRTILK